MVRVQMRVQKRVRVVVYMLSRMYAIVLVVMAVIKRQ